MRFTTTQQTFQNQLLKETFISIHTVGAYSYTPLRYTPLRNPTINDITANNFVGWASAHHKQKFAISVVDDIIRRVDFHLTLQVYETA